MRLRILDESCQKGTPAALFNFEIVEVLAIGDADVQVVGEASDKDGKR